MFVPYRNGAYAANSPHRGTADALSDELNEAANWQGSDAQRVNLAAIRLDVLPDAPTGPAYLPAPAAGADSLAVGRA